MRSTLRCILSMGMRRSPMLPPTCLMRSMLPAISVSGVRNSWEMLVKKSSLNCVRRFSTAMSRRKR